MFGDKQREIERLITENAQLRQDNQQLYEQVRQIRAGDFTAAEQRLQQLNSQASWLNQANQNAGAALAGAQQQLAAVQRETASMKAEADALRKAVVCLRETASLEELGLFGYPHPAKDSVELRAELTGVTTQAKSMVAQKTAFTANYNFAFNDSGSKGRRFVKDLSVALFRAYNAEAENAVLTVKAGNVDPALKRVQRAREQLTRLGGWISFRINDRYHWLRCREIELSFLHLEAKRREKEEAREERARLREERRVQMEMEVELERLRKERSHYQNALDKLRRDGKDEDADAIEAKLLDIDNAIEDVDYRKANVRAGYVYVISNIGSFGKGVVKIGMTRRLDPYERVRELSDASVPFNFDTHAMFFSADAVSVETRLHHIFEDQRINLVNLRREFFAVTPEQVRDALKTVPEAGALLEFYDEPDAEQYRESQAIRAGKQQPKQA